MEKPTSIRISFKLWRILLRLKLDLELRSIDDVIKLLLKIARKHKELKK